MSNTKPKQYVRNSPLEVRWITYRGLASEDFGRPGWATVGGEGPNDYIWYGPDGKSQAVYQAATTNAHYGFGRKVIVREPETIPFLDYEMGQWAQ